MPVCHPNINVPVFQGNFQNLLQIVLKVIFSIFGRKLFLMTTVDRETVAPHAKLSDNFSKRLKKLQTYAAGCFPAGSL